MHKLTVEHSIEKIATFLNRSPSTVQSQLTNDLSPSERAKTGEKPGKPAVISEAMKNDIILPLLQQSACALRRPGFTNF